MQWGVLAIALVSSACAACGTSDHPRAAGGGASSSTAPNDAGDTGASTGATAPPACTPWATLFSADFDESSDPGGDFYLFEGTGAPTIACDTAAAVSPSQSVLLTIPNGAAAALRFPDRTTLWPGHPLQVSFAFRVDSGDPPTAIGRIELGASTLEMRVAGSSVVLAVHASVTPWTAPFTDAPPPTESSPYDAGAWNKVAFDVASATPVPLTITLGSVYRESGATRVVRYDDLAITEVPCSDAGVDEPDAGTPAPR